ncbi:cation:proton antiporter [Candidatus Altiarchaeota archaeon]
MESILAAFTVCLTLAFLFSELFYRLRYPKVVGQILAGVVLGLPFIRVYFEETFISFVESLADLGVVFLLLLVGTEVRIEELKKVSRKGLLLALLGYSIPLTMGYTLMTILGYSSLTSVIVGICLAITATAITVEILIEYDLLNTDLGFLIMDTGIIDDFFAVFSLALVIGTVQGDGFETLRTLPGEFLTFIIMAYIIGFTILPKAAKMVWKEKSEAAVFSLAIIFGLLIVLLSNSFGLSSVLGAFVAGVIIQLSIKNKREEKEIVESLQIVTFGLIIPFFFIFVGLNFSIVHLFDNIGLIILLAGVALVGKILAANIYGAINNVGRIHAQLIGWGINSRGAVELIIATIALENNLISTTIFQAIVAMAVIASIISPMMFRRTLRKERESGSAIKKEHKRHVKRNVHAKIKK